MLVDCNTFSGGEVIQADVVIVGAGCAGLTAALALVDSGLQVAVLESGGEDYEDDTHALYEGEMLGLDTFTLDSHRARMLGGTGTLWAGWCARLSPLDFETRDNVPFSGWPIGRQDLDPFYEQAEALLGLSHFWDATAVAEAAGYGPWIPDGDLVANRFFQFADGRRRLWVEHGEALRLAANVTVYAHANLTDIVLDGSWTSVDHLVCKRLDQVSFTVEGARFALATGGIENARLLLASNGQIARGVANSSGVVGRFFQEHPHLRRSVIWNASEGVDFSSMLRHHLDLEVPGHGRFAQDYLQRLTVADAVCRSQALPSHTLFVRATSALDDVATGELEASVITAVSRFPGPADGAICDLVCEQTPSPDSRLTLHPTDVDALGMPRPQLDWRIAPLDFHRYSRITELLGAAIAERGLGRLWMPDGPDGFDWRPGPGDTTWAPPGWPRTPRMGSWTRTVAATTSTTSTCSGPRCSRPRGPSTRL